MTDEFEWCLECDYPHRMSKYEESENGVKLEAPFGATEVRGRWIRSRQVWRSRVDEWQFDDEQTARDALEWFIAKFGEYQGNDHQGNDYELNLKVDESFVADRVLGKIGQPEPIKRVQKIVLTWQHVAMHEAAHAVVGYVLFDTANGLCKTEFPPFSSVSIIPTEDSQGRCEPHANFDWIKHGQKGGTAWMSVGYAGESIDVLEGQRAHDECYEQDYRGIQNTLDDLLNNFGVPKSKHEKIKQCARKMADGFVRNGDCNSVIKTVATELLSRRKIPWEDVTLLIKNTLTPPSP